jgi:hypothetical protein
MTPPFPPLLVDIYSNAISELEITAVCTYSKVEYNY